MIDFVDSPGFSNGHNPCITLRFIDCLQLVLSLIFLSIRNRKAVLKMTEKKKFEIKIVFFKIKVFIKKIRHKILERSPLVDWTSIQHFNIKQCRCSIQFSDKENPFEWKISHCNESKKARENQKKKRKLKS